MSQTLLLLLPQVVLGVCACAFLLGGAWRVTPRAWGPLSLVTLALAGGALAYSAHVAPTGPIGPTALVTLDALSIGVQACCLVGGAILVLMSMPREGEGAAEFYALLLLLLAGLTLVSAANELVLLFLSLELISVPTYVLLYLGRKDYASQEAALKYFLLSVLSAAMLLYGFAFLYGLTGTTHLGMMRDILTATYYSQGPRGALAGGTLLGTIALVFVFAGLGFRMTAVPFHFYAPDVYQGTSAFNAGLLAVVPKAAGFVVLIRLAAAATVGFEIPGERLAIIFAGLTMTGGNCLALLQHNVRRLLAYSSVAHAGYMLIGVAVGFWDRWNPEDSLTAAASLPGGMQACLLYLLAYSLANLGLFAVLIYLARPNGRQVEHVDDLTGLVRTQPWLAVAAAVFLFSLAGIPPLPGFWGKLAVFTSALSVRIDTPNGLQMHSGFVVLAVLGVINATIGAVYYLRLVALMFLSEPLSTAKPVGGRSVGTAVACCLALSLALGIMPGPLFGYLDQVKLQGLASRVPAGSSLAQRASPDHRVVATPLSTTSRSHAQ